MILTIGIPTHNDFTGAWWTVTALRETHGPQLAAAGIAAEILIADNAPDAGPESRLGAKCRAWAAGPLPVRYVATPQPQGAAATKNRIFAEARGEYVVVIDSHVLICAGALVRLIDYYHSHPDADGLFHGALRGDDGSVMATHFGDQGRGGMWGTWALAWQCTCGYTFGLEHLPAGETTYYDLFARIPDDPIDRCRACGRTIPPGPWPGHEHRLQAAGFRYRGRAPDDAPFEIPASGMGLFSCRRDAWLGCHPEVRQFGGEEFCIHERYRRRGRSIVCLPFLQWTHHFRDPRDPLPYPASRNRMIANYAVELSSLGIPIDRCRRHVTAEIEHPMTLEAFDAAIVAELAAPPMPAPPVPAPIVPSSAVAKPCGGCGKSHQPSLTAPQSPPSPPSPPGVPVGLTPNLCHQPLVVELCRDKRVLVIGPAADPAVWPALAAAGVAELIPVDCSPRPLEQYFPGIASRKGAKAQRKENKAGLGASAPLREAKADVAVLQIPDMADATLSALEQVAAAAIPRAVLVGTHAAGETDHTGRGPGMLPAIREFCRRRPEWRVHSHSTAGTGLTVLSSDPADRPPLPGVWRQLANLTRAVAGHVADGLHRADDATIEDRLNVCATCPQRNDTRCSPCGCYVQVKATWRDQPCPLGYWPVDPPPQPSTTRPPDWTKPPPPVDDRLRTSTTTVPSWLYYDQIQTTQ